MATAGARSLSLPLWALWNPIGPVPLDEYRSYSGSLVTILQKAQAADQELTGGSNDFNDFVQLQRNQLSQSATDELAALLATLRDQQMGMPPDADADRHTAEILLDWYHWEMDDSGD